MNPYLRKFLTSGAAALAALATAGAATADAAPGILDLATDRDFAVWGAAGSSSAGSAVATGDFNGDGKADLVVGSPTAGSNAGRVDVVFGTADPQDVELAAIGGAGVTFTGAAGTQLGIALDAGDVNGDHVDDVIVGAHAGGNGRAYVIYGTPTPTDLDLDDPLGARGFTITGEYGGDTAGSAVSVLGDVNEDGRVDLGVGAYGRDDVGSSSGSAYVVFGQAGQGDVNLGALGADGIRFDGSTSGEALHSIVPAGDVDGDGTADILIGSQHASPLGRNRAGAAYVVYGSDDLQGIGLAGLGTDGLTIAGAQANEGAGRAVAPAGDVDGDGFDDVVLGATAGNYAFTGGGSAYVVLGRGAHSPASVDLAAADPRAVRIDGAGTNHHLGFTIGDAGDVNGDGLDDVLVPAIGTAYNGRSNAGSAYVVFGAETFAAPDLANPGAAGFRMDGAASGDTLGWINGAARTVRGTGDLNGDGRVDLVLTSASASRAPQYTVGRVDVVFGSTVAYAKGKQTAEPGKAYAFAPKHLTTKGAAALAIAPALPAGLSFDPATGEISGAPTAASPATTHVVTLTDDQGAQKTTVQLEVATPAPADPDPTDPGTGTPTDGGTPGGGEGTGGGNDGGTGGGTAGGGTGTPTGATPQAQALTPAAPLTPATPAPTRRPAARATGSTASTLTAGTVSLTRHTLAAPATLRVSLRKVSRAEGGRVRVGKAVRLQTVEGVAGTNAITLTTKGVKPGRYRVTISRAVGGKRVKTTRTITIRAARR